ncbi:MAG: hypothetical protein JRH14_06685, partial [Deltaproteobacteria bacterium]|nr:hypothetical protein [Deltaproteobacteria bacterium]
MHRNPATAGDPAGHGIARNGSAALGEPHEQVVHAFNADAGTVDITGYTLNRPLEEAGTQAVTLGVLAG